MIASGSFNRVTAAVDSNDHLHLAIWQGPDNDLVYATNRSGDWLMSTIHDEGDVGISASIVVDSADRVHILSEERGDLSALLVHWTDASGTWTRAVVDDDVGDLDKFGWACLGPNDSLHVGYPSRHAGLSDVRYATNADGAWEVTTVAQSHYVGEIQSNVGIAVDDDGNAHLSYGGENMLRYATNASGAWQSVLIDGTPSSPEFAMESSLALSPTGEVVIVYDYRLESQLRHAYGTFASFSTEVIGSDDNNWCGPALAIDPSGARHVGYLYRSSNELRHATLVSGSWMLEVAAEALAPTTIAGLYPAIAVDSQGRVHLVYGTQSQDGQISLWLATRTSVE